MITRRTDELKPGDVVVRFGGQPRTIASITPHKVEGLFQIRFEPVGIESHDSGAAEAEDIWQVDAPSPLDLAVQQAQELADQYADGGYVTGRDISELFDLFRAAR